MFFNEMGVFMNFIHSNHNICYIYIIWRKNRNKISTWPWSGWSWRTVKSLRCLLQGDRFHDGTLHSNHYTPSIGPLPPVHATQPSTPWSPPPTPQVLTLLSPQPLSLWCPLKLETQGTYGPLLSSSCGGLRGPFRPPDLGPNGPQLLGLFSITFLFEYSL